MSNKSGIADPTRLKRFDSNDKQLLRVVIETPKHSLYCRKLAGRAARDHSS